MINVLIVYGHKVALDIARQSMGAAPTVRLAQPQNKLYINKATGEETRVTLKLVNRADDIDAIRGMQYDLILEDTSFHDYLHHHPLPLWHDMKPHLLVR